MTPSRPYIMRALYEWIVDNDCTPYLLVDARRPGVEVPVRQGETRPWKVGGLSRATAHLVSTSNGGPAYGGTPDDASVIELLIGNEWISFNGRFGGTPTDILLPVSAVIGIYARENGQGMVFEAEDPSPEPPDNPPGDGGGPSSSKPEGRPALKIVK